MASGVSVRFFYPLPVAANVVGPMGYPTGTVPIRPHPEDSNIIDYTHSIEAVGGFDTAGMEIVADLTGVTDWFENGLGRHVVAYGEGGVVAWEGFVNQIDVTIGNLDMTVGPLMEVSNKVKVKYQTISWDIPDTPVRGIAKETSFATDATSQRRYFVLEQILNIGEASENLGQPEDVRDTYITEYAYPKVTQNVSLRGEGEPSVSLSCLGYHHLLSRFYYSNTGSSTSVNASAKIEDVISAEPNGIADRNYLANLETNTTPVSDHEEGDKTGWDVITDTISFGNQSQRRYIFGIEEHQRMYGYSIDPTPDRVDYEIGARETTRGLRHYGSGGYTAPELVRPGKWVFISDFMAADYTSPTAGGNIIPIYRFPYYMFIESVTYSAGGDLQIASGAVESVDRAIAQIGLEGLYT